jgi:hypothetical protein
VINKSSVVLDVKPWDDETALAALEAAVRGIAADGLVWQASQLGPARPGWPSALRASHHNSVLCGALGA